MVMVTTCIIMISRASNALKTLKSNKGGGNVARKFLHPERGEILCCMEELMFGRGVQYCSHREHQ
jgi:hypothetical protein